MDYTRKSGGPEQSAAGLSLSPILNTSSSAKARSIIPTRIVAGTFTEVIFWRPTYHVKSCSGRHTFACYCAADKTESFCTWQGFLIGLVAKRLIQWFNSFSAIDAAQVKSARICWSRCMSHSNASCSGKRRPLGWLAQQTHDRTTGISESS